LSYLLTLTYWFILLQTLKNGEKIDTISSMENRSPKTILLLLIFLLSLSAVSFSADEDIVYAARVPYRMFRGITNIALGWTEILFRPFAARDTEGVVESLGIAAAHTLYRIAVGSQDIFMSWVPDAKLEEFYPDWQAWPYPFHWT
jgi:hypothetical protein